MDFFEIFKTPKRPKFKFGEPLVKIYESGGLHAGIKDLFLKAYLSARDDFSDDDMPEQVVLQALKSGEKGQGTLSQRLALKSRLETGEWLIPAQTTRGAPLWLLRHFLGRLPQPLLQDSQWKALGRACGEAASGLVHQQELLERIAASAKGLDQPESEILALLTLLIRKFSSDGQREAPEVADALSQYFIASITSRPFRPGLYTAADRACQPLLVFVSRHWDSIFQEIPESSIANSTLHGDCFDESYQYFQDDTNFDHSPKKSIGFEHFKQAEEEQQEKEEEQPSPDENGVTDRVSMIKHFAEVHMKLFEELSLQKNSPRALTSELETNHKEEKEEGKGEVALVAAAAAAAAEEENVSSRFKLSEFLKSAASLNNSQVAASAHGDDDDDCDDENTEETEKHEFYSAPNSDDSL